MLQKNALFFLSRTPAHHSFTLNVIIAFKIQMIGKPHTILFPDL